MKNRYEVALKIQDAANPLAVVNELQTAMRTVFLDENKPIREDPAVWLIVDKLASMFRNSRLDVVRYGECVAACEAILKQQQEESHYVEDTDNPSSGTTNNGDIAVPSLVGHH